MPLTFSDIPHRNIDTWLMYVNQPTLRSHATKTEEVWVTALRLEDVLGAIPAAEIAAISSLLATLLKDSLQSPAAYRRVVAMLSGKAIISSASNDALADLATAHAETVPVMIQTGASIAQQQLGRPATRRDVETALAAASPAE